jgi:hypothetical protein
MCLILAESPTKEKATAHHRDHAASRGRKAFERHPDTSHRVLMQRTIQKTGANLKKRQPQIARHFE